MKDVYIYNFLFKDWFYEIEFFCVVDLFLR